MKHFSRAFLLSTALLLPIAANAQTYTYDNLGRVSSVVQPNGAKTVYYYDNLDNRTATQTATSGATTISAPPTNPSVILVTAGSTLRALADKAGYNGSATANYQFVVPAGTTIMGAVNGGRGLETGTWPAGVTLSLVVNGNIYGGGGNGGAGTAAIAPGANGSVGGDAVYAQAPIAIVVNTGGEIKGGGGGGGGASYSLVSGKYRGGGGGGGGFPNGYGAIGGTGPGGAGTMGSSGTTAGGGAGGVGLPAGYGGKGGNAGASGVSGGGEDYSSSGGAAGYAVRKNGNTVTITNNGTLTGSAA